MSDIKKTFSYPEIVRRMRNIAEAMIQQNGGLTNALRLTLYQKADEFNINRLDLDDILKNPLLSTIINEKDGTQLVLIPDGKFLAGGSRKNEGGSKPFPVRLPAYYLALYPVTNIQFARFLNQAQPSERDSKKWIFLDSDTFVQKAGNRFEACGDKDDHPVVNVTWFGAKAYAEWAGLRLPSELEWEKGARGADGREFPWGDIWDESKCRCAMNAGTESTCSVHSYPDGRSPWGIYQMAGNIWEWCEDSFDFNVYNRYRQGVLSPPEKDDWSDDRPKDFGGMLVMCCNEGFRVLRGGSWFSDNPNFFRGAFRSYGVSKIWNSSYGFRLARTASL